MYYYLYPYRPPFVASSQHKLAEYVCIGRFSRIPSKYSDELHWTISQLLHVNVSLHVETHTCTCTCTHAQQLLLFAIVGAYKIGRHFEKSVAPSPPTHALEMCTLIKQDRIPTTFKKAEIEYLIPHTLLYTVYHHLHRVLSLSTTIFCLFATLDFPVLPPI